jgi:hypothetical protein
MLYTCITGFSSSTLECTTQMYEGKSINIIVLCTNFTSWVFDLCLLVWVSGVFCSSHLLLFLHVLIIPTVGELMKSVEYFVRGVSYCLWTYTHCQRADKVSGLFCKGRLVLFLDLYLLLVSWWSQWVVMAACHCYAIHEEEGDGLTLCERLWEHYDCTHCWMCSHWCVCCCQIVVVENSSAISWYVCGFFTCGNSFQLFDIDD